jgi:hypothetical protein
MTKYARFDSDGRVIETFVGDPKISFCPEIAKEFIKVPDDTEKQDKKTTKGWEKYSLPELPEPPAPKRFISQAELKSFMTRPERLAFKAAAASDPIIEDFAETLAAGPLVITDDETVEAIDKLQSLKVLTAVRATQLKALGE